MKRYHHILVPIDFSPASIQALEEALNIRNRYHCQLTVVNYVTPLPATCYGDMVSHIEGGMEKTAVKEMAELATKYQLNAQQMLVEIGQAKTAIPLLAKERGIDLIVISNHSHHYLLSNFLMRSTSCRIAYHSPCDVYIVHH